MCNLLDFVQDRTSPDLTIQIDCERILPQQVLAGRSARRLLFLRCMRLVASDEATRGSAEDAVMSGIVAGDAADQSALDASFGLGHGGCEKHEGSKRCSRRGFEHVGLLGSIG
jgi:hypothetical protein